MQQQTFLKLAPGGFSATGLSGVEVSHAVAGFRPEHELEHACRLVFSCSFDATPLVRGATHGWFAIATDGTDETCVTP